MIPSDLPIVLPHQEGLDFTVTVEKEQELVDEVEQLRKRLDEVRSHHPYFHISNASNSFLTATKTKSLPITIHTH